MRRNNRRTFNSSEENESKRLIIISLSILIIAIVAFAITYVIYKNYLNKNFDVSEFETYQITELSKINETVSSQEASSNIGKKINEIEELNEQANENVIEKIAINTSNMVKENIEVETKKENEEEEIKKEEKVADPIFKKPVEGEIITDFAKETLIYSNTLQEWVTHNGIDIKAEKTTIVKASAEGKIKSIKNDPRYGITVVIEHTNGYSSIYSNLLTAEFVKEGEVVKQGQTIGTVGSTATFEIADDTHLHFEIMKDNENVDPNLYLK